MIIRFGREDYIDTKALKELVEENEENVSGATQDNQEEQL